MRAAKPAAPSGRRHRAVSLWTGGDDLDEARTAFAGFADAIRRHRIALVVWVVLCLAVAGTYARATTPEYLASVQLMLQGGHKAEDGPDDASLSHQLELGGAEIETQLAVMRSPGLLQPVFDTLRLDAAPELIGTVTAPARQRTAGAREEQRRHDLFAAFRNRVGARRVGLSTTVEVSYRAPDPAQAVRVANAVAVAYVHDRIRTAMVDTRAFTPYLSTRIAAILTEAALAAEAVRKGGLPDAEFIDADVRLLGPARMPLAPAYPRMGPIATFAIGFGLISGLLVIAIMHRFDATIRTRAQLRHGFGIEAFGVPMEAGRLTSQATFVGLATAISTTPAAQTRQRAIGIGGWEHSAAPRLIGAALAEVMRSAGTPARLVAPDGSEDSAPADLPTRPTPGTPEVAIVALPAFATPAVLPRLDAVVLVALAGRTTIPALRQALRAAGGGRRIPVAAIVLVEAPPARARPVAGRWWPFPRLTIGASQNNTLEL